jgi:hypothetical protein
MRNSCLMAPTMVALLVLAGLSLIRGSETGTCGFQWSMLEMLTAPGQVCTHNSTCSADCQGNLTQVLVACRGKNYTNEYGEVLSFDAHVAVWLRANGPRNCDYRFMSACDAAECTMPNIRHNMTGCAHPRGAADTTAVWEQCPGVSMACKATFASVQRTCGDCRNVMVARFIESAAGGLPACDGAVCISCSQKLKADISASCAGLVHPPVCSGACQKAVLAGGEECPGYFLDNPREEVGTFLDCNGSYAKLQMALARKDNEDRTAKCSNHGQWDETQCICACDSGFSGDACVTRRSASDDDTVGTKASKLPTWAIILLAILAVGASAAAVVLWRRCRQRRNRTANTEIHSPLTGGDSTAKASVSW